MKSILLCLIFLCRVNLHLTWLSPGHKFDYEDIRVLSCLSSFTSIPSSYLSISTRLLLLNRCDIFLNKNKNSKPTTTSNKSNSATLLLLVIISGDVELCWILVLLNLVPITLDRPLWNILIFYTLTFAHWETNHHHFTIFYAKITNWQWSILIKKRYNPRITC